MAATDPTKNLVPWKPGQSGNPKGRPKGRISLSTMVKRLAEEPDLVEKVIKGDDLPDWWEHVPEKSFNAAITMAMFRRAVVSENVDAATWVRKTGYGDLLDDDGEENKDISGVLDSLDDTDTQRQNLADEAAKALNEQHGDSTKS